MLQVGSSLFEATLFGLVLKGNQGDNHNFGGPLLKRDTPKYTIIFWVCRCLSGEECFQSRDAPCCSLMCFFQKPSIPILLVLSRECGNQPRDSLKGNHKLDGLSWGHSISHSLPTAPAIPISLKCPISATRALCLVCLAHGFRIFCRSSHVLGL